MFRIVVSLVISMQVSFAFADSGMSYNSEAILKMTALELTQLNEKMRKALLEAQEVIQRDAGDPKVDIQKLLPKIAELRKFQTQESFSQLLAVFRAEIERMKSGEGFQPSVIAIALDSIREIGTTSPHQFLEDYLKLVDDFEGSPVADSFGSFDKVFLQNKAASTYSAIKLQKETMVDLNRRLWEVQEATKSIQEELDKVEQVLSEGLIGQPEVLQALMDLEWRNRLYGKNRTLPDAVYLMGLPGTGKDTAAEVFTDALHGEKNAHRTHMFRLPVMKFQPDLWKVLGSATGYIGSEHFPPFLDFLVQHSGGKYKLEEVRPGTKKYKVVENPDYKGELLPGYYPPSSGIVFANEFHNWSKQLKDDFLKQALEKGVFDINNPNGGLAQIYVPIRFIIASNEGIRELTSREANGQRHGKALTYDKILAKWESVHQNKALLKNAILATNGSPNMRNDGHAPGVSEELLNRIPERFILMMRPLSEEHLQQVAEVYLRDLSSRLSDSPLVGKIQLKWSERVPEVLQGYDYTPEENARPISGRVTSMIEEPLLDAVRAGKLERHDGQIITLDIEENEDKTQSLVITSNFGGRQSVAKQLIRTTLKDIPKPAIEDSKIDDMAGFENYMKANVFGIDNVIERLSERFLSIENEAAAGQSARPVNVIMLNGLSSTGKSETAKQAAKFVTKADDELVTFNFGLIQSLHDFKVNILGTTDSLGNPIPSEFMKQFDRAQGRLMVAFDELANVENPDLLKTLYDFFREPIVRTFSDGKARPMGGVTVIVTGNSGQEQYLGVPRHVPMEVQMLAWEEIAKQTNNNLELQRRILERSYPEPLITRIGRNNIFFLPPHSYKSLRQLSQLKLGQALERLASQKSRRGWNVVFSSADEYSKFIDIMISEGFSLRYQGAAIDSFVRDDMEGKLHTLLLKNKVPSGATVVLKFREMTANDNEDVPGFVFYDVYVDSSSKPLELKIQRPHVEKPLEVDPINQIITAFHEVGHALVRNAVFPESHRSTMISVIPGVTPIGDQWIYYAGVAKSQQHKEVFTSRDWAIRSIAVLLAGETAERLVSKGSSHSTGKSNDIERASTLARNAIIRYGLSERWGLQAIPTGISNEEYVAGLSNSAKRLLEQEVDRMLKEGRHLAQQTIEANWNQIFVPLSLRLVEQGNIYEEELASYLKNVIDPTSLSYFGRTMNHARTLRRKLASGREIPGTVSLDPDIPMPKEIANIDAIAQKRKADQFAQVPLPEKLPVGTNRALEDRLKKPDSAPTEASCEVMLGNKAS